MRIAAFNVENMFERAIALNGDDWRAGRAALEAHRELNRLFQKPAYGAADRRRMLALLDAHGLLRDDKGPLLRLRRIRGRLLARPRRGEVSVVAAGRDDWIGWVELETEEIRAAASENLARVLDAVGADVVGVVEAEHRTALKRFNDRVMPIVGASPYRHVMLIDGNDERGIDVGLLARAAHPIRSMRSHVDDRDEQGPIFSRDCPEYELALPGGGSLWLLVNHLKSKGYGRQADNDALRFRQAARIRELCEAHLAAGHVHLALVGDLNDTPASAPLAPLLGQGSPLRDASTHPAFDDGGRPGTHGHCTARSKIDYILLSPALFERMTAGGIERRGMWGGKNGTLWPRFPEVASAKDAASDHAAIWADVSL